MTDYQSKFHFDFDNEALRLNGPRWKAGDYLIVEHLTMEDLQDLGETPTSDGVVRLSLADDVQGTNSRKPIECTITIEERDKVQEALLTLSDWAHGFVLASTLRNEPMGMVCRSPKIRGFRDLD